MSDQAQSGRATPWHLLPPGLHGPENLAIRSPERFGLSWRQEADGSFTPITPQTPSDLLAILQQRWAIVTQTVVRVLYSGTPTVGATSRRREADRLQLWRVARDARLWLNMITGEIGPPVPEPETLAAAMDAFQVVMADVQKAATADAANTPEPPNNDPELAVSATVPKPEHIDPPQAIVVMLLLYNHGRLTQREVSKCLDNDDQDVGRHLKTIMGPGGPLRSRGTPLIVTNPTKGGSQLTDFGREWCRGVIEHRPAWAADALADPALRSRR